MRNEIINKILWGILILAVNFILAAIFYIPLLSKGADSTNVLNVFFYSFILFSFYTVYLIYCKLSEIKVTIYCLFVIGLILSVIFVDGINVQYTIDICLDYGGHWNYEQNKCEGSR